MLRVCGDLLGRPAEREAQLQQRIADGYEALELMEEHLRSHASTHVAHEERLRRALAGRHRPL